MNTAPQVVLIDDNLAWLESLAEFLGRRGLTTTTTSDAGEGLALLATQPARMVLIDLHMPGMDGIEFLRQLRRSRRDVAVLVVSSDDEPETVARVLAEGALGLVPKNIAPALLLKAVLGALQALEVARIPPEPRRYAMLLLPFHPPRALLPFLPS